MRGVKFQPPHKMEALYASHDTLAQSLWKGFKREGRRSGFKVSFKSALTKAHSAEEFKNNSKHHKTLRPFKHQLSSM
ncbi:hypothetical protein NHP21005_12770 [Helicobacter sp. NHP21005]|nr:hypothetical protein NHP21005_12770 [Helicobacter sp. NHP21005]